KGRLSLRSLPRDAQPPDPRQLNSRGIFQGDALPETDLGEGGLFPATTLSLAPMQMGREGGRQSWAEIVLGLRDRFGPFRLAFLEMLVRAADVRASMREEKK
ncbi:MAG: CRISPR-associated helicase/endonuclease Cas3, partial [Acidobacteria bacterium]|nr:CRISPR-associated helicase/endonuclease Cas3 [Acidobacteriota bacterium]